MDEWGGNGQTSKNYNLSLTDVNYLTFYAGGYRFQNLGYWCYSPGLHSGFDWKWQWFLQKREDESPEGDANNKGGLKQGC